MHIFKRIEANNGNCLNCGHTLIKGVVWGIEYYKCEKCETIHTKHSYKSYVKQREFDQKVWKL